MSADSSGASRSLPEKPDLRHLKNQAKDLLRAGAAVSLADAQFQLAREYGFASWPKLKAHVESLKEIGQLKAAIDANDLARVQALMTRNPVLHRAPLGYNRNGPLTWAAECRGVAPTAERLAIIRWMLENGSDVHQGGDGPLMRAALADERVPVMEPLVEHGADVNALWNGEYPIIFAACETLQPRSLAWLIAHGADMHAESKAHGTCVEMLLGTYWRNPEGKHGCLEVFARAGFPFPETAPMAVHRGRVDLLAALVDRDPAVVDRRFRTAEIYPPELVEVGLHVAPLDGATLLHMAVEYQEAKIAQWLIDHGADVNARAEVDADGFGGHTPLFHATVTLLVKPDDTLARLLLRNGADPNLRATFRKQLSWNGDAEKERMREYHDVTAIGFARQFQEPSWVNEAAIEAIRQHGGE
ncbi:MAG TPA: ankyrin repeat domain-containing protein [Pirellulales bacterium]|nr:ankyrin repeat domain-containing protein [Pirellulales bacterium]